MRSAYFFILAVALTLLSPREASADDVGHNLSLTLSPLHLFFPVVEVTGELRLPFDFSVAAIGGYGAVEGVAVWEAGAQARYYLLGGFEHGMPLGVEALYVGAADRVDGVTATAAGLAVGPFVGYKLATDVGFTLDTALGIQVVTVSARASGSGASASASETAVIPLLNLNLGWSF